MSVQCPCYPKAPIESLIRHAARREASGSTKIIVWKRKPTILEATTSTTTSASPANSRGSESESSFYVHIMTLSSPPIPLFHQSSTTVSSLHNIQSDTQTDLDSHEDEYLATVKRMHAKQDAWSRAARSASASASASESPSASGSRSPSKVGDGQYGGTGGISSSSIGEPSGSGSGQQKKSRKKVAKACLACQKSHVTCDDSEIASRTKEKRQTVLTSHSRAALYALCEKGNGEAMC